MILLDTIAYNTFLAIVRDEPTRVIQGLNKEKFANFIMNYKEHKFIHSATIFELYMRDLKNPNINNFNCFVKDFNSLKNYGFKIMNDNTWNFDWQSLAAACENEVTFDMSIYIRDKVEYETTSISRYFTYILYIVCDKLFDIYGEKVGVELFDIIMRFNFDLTEAKLKEYLFSYYTTDEKKEVSTKKFDNLLGYILYKMEEIIKNKLTLIQGIIIPEQYLIEVYSDYEELESMEISGVEKAREILKGLTGKELNNLIINKVEEVESKVISENKRFLTDNEKLYFIHVILNKALQQGYKVTKNDFSDCVIFSAFDGCNKSGKLITFDKTLKKMLENFKVFYDEIIYNEITD